ncbi:hypothetical protein [Rhodococcus koreensis]|jgi:hypothetical protein|uniref:hypothetical protein n=1 Tax=Rhodococcus koreensis TaxID=99653 RepID=UPI00115FD776|nr:hypothetical protein JWS14_38315 [Rhodococcus koreensis]
MLDAECANAQILKDVAAEILWRHPDHAIITSFSGLADVTGARVLAEIGDDRGRSARRTWAEGVCRVGTGRSCIGAQHRSHSPPREEQPVRRSQVRLAFVAAGRECRPARTTLPGVTVVIATRLHCSTACSVNFIAACKPVGCTTRAQHFPAREHAERAFCDIGAARSRSPATGGPAPAPRRSSLTLMSRR